MLDFISGRLQAIPAPTINPPVMSLADLIGTDAATQTENAGSLLFHAVGDTGVGSNTPQEDVANAMTQDYVIANPVQSPAFFLHLGDVVYGPNKIQEYRPEFYEPYRHYPGKIIAIPGNHDGEVFPSTDPESLRAFWENFCADPAHATVPAVAGTILREPMTQPGAYWYLDAPFVDIIGLYSNAAENPGFISGAVPGQAQKDWLIATLQQIAQERGRGNRKGLVIATHHPPYSTGGHSGSQDMLADIDQACAAGGATPDVFLSGHAHSYQRYTRRIPVGGNVVETPFIVAGIGGHNAQAITPADGSATGDHTFDKSRQGYGYLLVEASASTIVVRAIGVDGTQKGEFDRVSVNLVTRRIS
jgi:hypothetical protein